MSNFFTNETVSLEKDLEMKENPTRFPDEDIERIFEVSACAEWVKQNDFRKVCLQFPDHLLPNSNRVASKLEEKLGFLLYILADTSYGSCCVDYVAAAHINADAIVHFGPVCSSKPSGTIPTLNIYEKKNLDLNKLYKSYTELTIKPLILLDTGYIHLIDDIKSAMTHTNCQIETVTKKTAVMTDSDVLFITDCQKKLVNFRLSFKAQTLYYWMNDSIVLYQEDGRLSRRRLFLIEKIKDCSTLGIVIGTLAVKNYLTVIERLKRLATLHEKKYYLISVGKPTVAKLANFPEIDVFVVISCALNETIDSRDYYKPLVTPYDVEIALNPLSTSSNTPFTYDYNDFIENPVGDDVTPLIGDISLITGNLRSPAMEITTSDVTKVTDITVKDNQVAALSHGAGFLSTRSWRGLDPKLGEHSVVTATEGRKGIAQRYSDELT